MHFKRWFFNDANHCCFSYSKIALLLLPILLVSRICSSLSRTLILFLTREFVFSMRFNVFFSSRGTFSLCVCLHIRSLPSAIAALLFPVMGEIPTAPSFNIKIHCIFTLHWDRILKYVIVFRPSLILSRPHYKELTTALLNTCIVLVNAHSFIFYWDRVSNNSLVYRPWPIFLHTNPKKLTSALLNTRIVLICYSFITIFHIHFPSSVHHCFSQSRRKKHSPRLSFRFPLFQSPHRVVLTLGVPGLVIRRQQRV